MVVWDFSGRETPATLSQGRLSWERGWQAAPVGTPALLLHSLLLSRGESEWLRAGMFWGSGVSWAQGGVASPQGLLPTEVVFGWKV